jgi:hypothetical protein
MGMSHASVDRPRSRSQCGVAVGLLGRHALLGDTTPPVLGSCVVLWEPVHPFFLTQFLGVPSETKDPVGRDLTLFFG